MIILKDLILNPNLLDKLRKDGKNESKTQQISSQEDGILDALDKEIEKYPICKTFSVN